MKKQISIGAFISYFTIGINILIGLFYTPWMVHAIGDSDYALYNLALSVINIFIMDFGLSSATSRFLSNYYANDKKEQANGFLGITLRLYIIIDIVLFSILFVFYFLIELIYVKLTPDEIHIFKVLYLIVAFYSLMSFPLLNLNGVLLAKERFVAVKLCGLFQKLLTVSLVIGALAFDGNVYALVLANAGSSIFFSIIKLILVKRENIRFDIHYRDGMVQKELLGFSVWTTVVQFMQRFVFSLAPTLLAMYSNSREVAYFSLASTIEGYVWTIGDAINGMFMPRIARLNTERNADKKISDLMCKVGKFQIFVIGMICITFALVGNDFVMLWMGKGYEKVAICAVFIIIPVLQDMPQQIGKTTMLVRNKVKLQAIVYMITIMFYLPIAVFLTKAYGVIGTAVAIFIAYTLRSIVMSILYQIKLNLDVKRFYLKVYGHWIFSGMLSFVILKIILYYVEAAGFGKFLIKCGICIITYAALMWLFFFSREEKKGILCRLGIIS